MRTILYRSLYFGVFAFAAAVACGGDVLYNRDIRPILADACFSCHGPDSAAREADLRLDQSESAFDMAAIVPGAPDESEMLRRILSDDPDERMPPPETKKRLKREQIETLRRWIEDGAVYQPHWSFIAPERSDLPAVRNESWVRNPIDRFILARLEREGLEPNGPASRRTLARRVSLDLTGLPPAPELVNAFVADHAAGAYERLVDKLLDSPHYGEHRARYWLDAARYADTHGLHFDNFREMWTYRDWVINALNDNMPFDQFTIQQLAGDLLPNRTLDQQIASGFNRCNVTTSEGGTIEEEVLVFYNRDRTETFGQVWMGLTVGCAVCHDHKFDPVSQKEFYSLAAFFNNTTQSAMDGNVSNTPPIVFVPSAEDRQRWQTVGKEIAETERQMDELRQVAAGQLEGWLASLDRDAIAKRMPEQAPAVHAPLDDGAGRTTTVTVGAEPFEGELNDNAEWREGPFGHAAVAPNGSVFEHPTAANFDRTDAFSVSVWVYAAPNDANGPIVARMDAKNRHRGWDILLAARRVMPHIIHDWPSNGLKVKTEQQMPANQWVHLTVTYDGSGKASGVQIFFDGQLQEVAIEYDSLTDTTLSEAPLTIGRRDGAGALGGVTLSDLRIYPGRLSHVENLTLANGRRLEHSITNGSPALNDKDRELLVRWKLDGFDAEFQQLREQLTRLQSEKVDIRERGTICHVMEEKSDPAMAYVLERGAYDQRREQVTPNTPDILPPMASDLPRDRLGLAHWLLTPEHPLTARVIVNRYWQEIFGRGLVATPGDFGVAGGLPSHADLLDWLAVEFREGGWNVKQLIKLLVTSAAYRQDAAAIDFELEHDRDNLLLSRGPRFRMDGEMVRDYALAASGLLVRQIGGPSAKPYQPPGVWEAVAINGSNTQYYKQDSGDNLYRRSLYTFWKRSAPPASMEIFNAPAREFCVVARERTNTPLQALAALNDVQLVEAARRLAEDGIKNAETFDDRLLWMSERALTRPLSDVETSVVRQSWEQMLHHYQQHSDDAQELLAYGEYESDRSLDQAQLAAWTMTANQLLNLDEALNK